MTHISKCTITEDYTSTEDYFKLKSTEIQLWQKTVILELLLHLIQAETLRSKVVINPFGVTLLLRRKLST